MAEVTAPANTSAGVRWDLASLFSGSDAAREALAEALDGLPLVPRALPWPHRRARRRGLSPTRSAELSALDNRLSRIASYAGLRLSVNVAGEDERDVNAAVDQGMVEAQNALRFFELEWIVLDERCGRAAGRRSRGRAAIATDLKSLRRFAPHTRTEPEEDMLAERDPAASGAWQTLFDQVTSSLSIPFDGAERTIDEVLSFVRDERRERRIAAYEALCAALEPHTPTQAHVYDTIVGDRLALDRVRAYASPRDARDLANELPPAAVDAMLAPSSAPTPRAPLVAAQGEAARAARASCWPTSTRPSARAGIFPSTRRPSSWPRRWAASRRGSRQVARALYAERRIDAEPRPGKRGGAFCASVAQDAQARSSS